MTFIKYVPFSQPCMSPKHNPPSHMVLPPGTHTWKCTSCGKETIFVVPNHFWSTNQSPPTWLEYSSGITL